MYIAVFRKSENKMDKLNNRYRHRVEWRTFQKEGKVCAKTPKHGEEGGDSHAGAAVYLLQL